MVDVCGWDIRKSENGLVPLLAHCMRDVTPVWLSHACVNGEMRIIIRLVACVRDCAHEKLTTVFYSAFTYLRMCSCELIMVYELCFRQLLYATQLQLSNDIRNSLYFISYEKCMLFHVVMD